MYLRFSKTFVSLHSPKLFGVIWPTRKLCRVAIADILCVQNLCLKNKGHLPKKVEAYLVGYLGENFGSGLL